MKKIMLFAALVLLSFSLSAQPADGRGPGRNWEDKIRAEKIAHFTAALDLTPEEAQLFWPVYNQYWKENMEAHGKTMKAFHKLRSDKETKLSDKELESLTDAYMSALDAEQKVLDSYYPKFKKVLSAEKLAKLFVAEEDFRMKMIRNLGMHQGDRNQVHGDSAVIRNRPRQNFR